jgi:hypothetical protein
VLALDTCPALLQLLAERGRGLPLRVLEEDLRRFRRHVEEPAAAIVCMGDVLIHLDSRDEVRAVLADAAQALRADGRLAVAFRDLTSIRSRFVHVRGDRDRILTCVLDEERDFVVVNDVLHEREGSRWTMSVSSYRKLRLSPEDVRADAAAAGLDVTALSVDQGLVTMVARPVRRSFGAPTGGAT